MSMMKPATLPTTTLPCTLPPLPLLLIAITVAPLLPGAQSFQRPIINPLRLRRCQLSKRLLTSWNDRTSNYIAAAITNEKLLSWASSSSSSASSTIRIESSPSTEIRGLYAQRDIRQNEIIVKVPFRSALLVGDTLRRPEQLGSEVDGDVSEHLKQQQQQHWNENDVEDVLQGLYFLKNFVARGSFFDGDNNKNIEDGDDDATTATLDDRSEYYAPYVTTLPPKPAANTFNDNGSSNYDDIEGLTPDFWSDSIIKDIGIPSYSRRILDRKQIIRTMARCYHVNESDLQWATFLVRSRRFTTWNMVLDPNHNNKNIGNQDDDNDSLGRGGGGSLMYSIMGMMKQQHQKKKVEQIQGFLVPLIDMANHNSKPNAEMQINMNLWIRRQFDESSSFILRAIRPIPKGEEVTICYGDGESTCLDLLDKYGFFVENGGGADDRIDLEELKPTWITSLEEDEMELDRLLRESSCSMSGTTKAVPPSLVDSKAAEIAIMKENDDYEEGNGVVGSASRRSMLSLRIWLKRLKKWKRNPPGESSSVASSVKSRHLIK